MTPRFAVLLIVVMAGVASLAQADSVSLVPDLKQQVVFETASGGLVKFTLTYHGENELTIKTVSTDFLPNKLTDVKYDQVTGTEVLKDGCKGTTLKDDGTCSFILFFSVLDADKGDEKKKELDSGSWLLTGTVIFDPNKAHLIGASALSKAKVTDRTTITPEPSTYFLFGTGLASMAGLIRWKLSA